MSKLHRVKSFEDFVGELQERKPRIVAIQASRRAEPGVFQVSNSWVLGRLGTWQHGLVYTAHSEKSQRLYNEPLFSVFQTEHGIGDAVERNHRIMSCLLAAEIRVELLSAELPETDVYVATENPTVRMDASLLQLLHEQAVQYDIQPAGRAQTV